MYLPDSAVVKRKGPAGAIVTLRLVTPDIAIGLDHVLRRVMDSPLPTWRSVLLSLFQGWKIALKRNSGFFLSLKYLKTSSPNF